MKTFLRRLRGAFMNGVVWAFGWALTALGITIVLRIGGGPRMPSFVDSAITSVGVGGTLGFLAGITFSLALTLVFRNRSLHDVSVLWFSLAGAAVSALLLPGMFFLPSLLSGSIESAAAVIISFIVAAAVGGATALGMIKLAKAAPDARSALGSDEHVHVWMHRTVRPFPYDRILGRKMCRSSLLASVR